MNKNGFFKPTQLFKEYLILDMIEKDPSITQRVMAATIGTSVSMVNDYLFLYEENGYITKLKHNNKNVEYFLTKKGIERRKLLNIWYLKSSHEVYLSAKDNIIKFLDQIINKGFKKILLYGAGEVAEIILLVLNDYTGIDLEALAVIDDDKSKTGNILANHLIIHKEAIKNYEHDGILVSSYTHKDTINKNLETLNYPKEKIINFFD